MIRKLRLAALLNPLGSLVLTTVLSLCLIRIPEIFTTTWIAVLGGTVFMTNALTFLFTVRAKPWRFYWFCLSMYIGLAGMGLLLLILSGDSTRQAEGNPVEGMILLLAGAASFILLVIGNAGGLIWKQCLVARSQRYSKR